jgi:hypothetical protein
VAATRHLNDTLRAGWSGFEIGERIPCRHAGALLGAGIAPGNLMFYRGTQTFPQWNGNGFISGLGTTSLNRIIFDGHGAAKSGERWNVGHRIRDVEEGPDGSPWMLEDANPGALIHVTPQVIGFALGKQEAKGRKRSGEFCFADWPLCLFNPAFFCDGTFVYEFNFCLSEGHRSRLCHSRNERGQYCFKRLAGKRRCLPIEISYAIPVCSQKPTCPRIQPLARIAPPEFSLPRNATVDVAILTAGPCLLKPR